MFTRISSLLLCAALAGCGSGSVPEKASVDGAEEIACAVAGAKESKPVCAVERAVSKDGLILTIHHPDGGFRRFLVTGDGRGVIPADGAGAVVLAEAGSNLVDVAIDGDHYRLPATFRK